MSKNLHDVRGLNLALNSGALAVGTAGATLDTGATINFLNDGEFKSKTAITSGAITASTTVIAALYSALFTVSLDADGNMTVSHGQQELTADVTAGRRALHWPQPPAGDTVIGGFRIDVASGYSYTPGTTENGATGITDTYYNFGCLPVEPITS